MKEQERLEKNVTALFFFHQRNTVTEPRGGFSSQLRGLFELDLLLIEMNRPNITTPYNSILGTDGRVIWEDTFSNPQSSHVLRHSGMSEREERGWKSPMTLRALRRIRRYMHSHKDSSERHLQLLAVGQTDFTVDRRMRSKTTERCRGECFLSFTSHPAVRAAGCSGQRSACQTEISKRGFDPSSPLTRSSFSESERKCFFNCWRTRSLQSFPLFYPIEGQLSRAELGIIFISYLRCKKTTWHL